MDIDQKAVRSSAGRVRVGYALLALALVGVALYFWPSGSEWNTLYYPPVGLLSAVVIVVGVRAHRPENASGWYCIAAGIAVCMGGDILWRLSDIVGVISTSSYDILYLAGYAALITGVIRLLPTGRRDLSSVLDISIVVVAGAVVVWVFLAAPYAGDSSLLFWEKVTSLIYPLMDFVLFAGVAKGVLMAGRTSVSSTLLLAAASMTFVTDLVYGVGLLDGSYVPGGILDAGWLAAFLTCGVAALHPSMSTPTTTSEHSASRMNRLWVVGSALFVMPVILAVLASLSMPLHLVEIVAASMVMTALVLVRLGFLMKELRAKVIEVEARRRELDLALSEREVLTQELFHNANHDALTGLSGRALFYQRAEQALSIRGATSALLFIDLDDFKTVNDTFGHQCGDQLLMQVAERLRALLRFGDAIGRFGGDEFAVLLQQVSNDKARQVADRIVESLAMPFELDDTIVAIGASVGGAIGGDGTDIDALVSAADTAMYVAKGRGKNSSVFVGDRQLTLSS